MAPLRATILVLLCLVLIAFPLFSHLSSAQQAFGDPADRKSEGFNAALLGSVPPSLGWNMEKARLNRILAQSESAIEANVDEAILKELDSPQAPLAPLTLLALERTKRLDPLDDFRYYTGGWDIRSRHYWASTAWSLFFAPMVGIIWLLVGLSFIIFLVSFCVCCRGRWTDMREHSSYSRIQLLLALILMVLAFLIAATGFALIIDGEVRLKRDVESVTDSALEAADGVVSLCSTVATVMTNAPVNFTNHIPLPDPVVENLQKASSRILEESERAREFIHLQKHGFQKCTRIGAVVLIVSGATLLGLMAFGLGQK